MFSAKKIYSLTETFSLFYRYADRAKKIKIKLKKNILSVDFQVGQYAKIVEDLKSQLNECKTKIQSLEEENEALKNQIELDDQERVEAKSSIQNQGSSLAQNHEEMEMLKAQLAELEVGFFKNRKNFINRQKIFKSPNF